MRVRHRFASASQWCGHEYRQSCGRAAYDELAMFFATDRIRFSLDSRVSGQPVLLTVTTRQHRNEPNQ
jgi:hypothetical protein